MRFREFMKNHKNKFAIVLIVVLAATFYLLTLRGVSGNADSFEEYKHLAGITAPFETSHERASYMQMLAIKDGSLDLTKAQADFGAPDVGFYQGKFYSYFPPGASLLITPLYLAGINYDLGQLLSYSTISLFAVLSLILVFQLAREGFKLPIWASLFAAIVFGFGSTAWSYSNTIYQHIPTAFLFLLAFYAVWKFKQQKKYSWPWGIGAWFIYGISWFFDYPNAIILLPLMLYFLIASLNLDLTPAKLRIRLRASFIITSIIFISVIALHGYYNVLAFGKPLQFSNTLPRYEISNYEELIGVDTEVVASQKSEPTTIFREVNLARGVYELTVAPDKGLFFFSPIFLMGLLGVYYLRRQINLEVGILLGAAATTLLLYGSFADPYGGWAYGPRYLIPVMPILALFAGFAIYRSKLWGRVTGFILFLISSAIALLGALTTNLTPPKVEADYLGLKYGIWQNWDVFQQGKSGSFIYNTYLSNSLTLQEYFAILYIALALIAGIIIFVLPKVKYLNYES